ncbi:DNA repair protein RadC [Stenotrophomonas sp. 278]|uniref:RadC family protein n=1 Tax=Stenotrophomonas sp. 278 TaxID=2479851 RepID=UPI000F65DCFF|nr:DNA repair protein RadC [Stenotrophomonas sp. 278]RRU09829.1 JAB domain-containing protein [Stenotrophomonas sp. 278]
MPNVSDWPKDERPRESLIANGPAALSDTQLVALLLMTGQKGRHVMDIARELLEHHGPLRKLLDMPAKDLSKLPGLGMAKACMLVASLELARRHLSAKLAKGELLSDPLAARQYFKQRLRGRPVEVFAALFLDNRHRMLAFEELFSGTIDASGVYPREVARHALLHNAAAVIVGHNHPSGHAEPSAADRHVTVELQAALQLVGVRLLDHIVVGEGEPVSMAERGWLGRV